jgi:hypothetical protein
VHAIDYGFLFSTSELPAGYYWQVVQPCLEDILHQVLRGRIVLARLGNLIGSLELRGPQCDRAAILSWHNLHLTYIYPCNGMLALRMRYLNRIFVSSYSNSSLITEPPSVV